jgi:hypothetical protein
MCVIQDGMNDSTSRLSPAEMVMTSRFYINTAN